MTKRRVLGVVCLSYFTAWAATVALGAPAAKRAVFAQFGDGIELVDQHTGESSMAVTLETSVPVPFHVRVATDYRGAIWCGEGVDWTLFTLPGKAWIMGKRLKWVS